MKPFDINHFMHAIRLEAGVMNGFADASWRELPILLHLEGEPFVHAAYWFILQREVDKNGLAKYAPFAETLSGRLRIVFTLFCSRENRRNSSTKQVMSWLLHGIGKSALAAVRRICPCKNQDQERKHNADAFYCAFEDRFRGDFPTIYARLEARYSAVLEYSSTSKQSLDLGCGRGEAVAFFAAHGFQATGVDGNRQAVEGALARGLHVVHDDLFAYLAAVPPNSQAVVSAFHVIEHLPFERLMELANAAWRVLQPGGLFILETPNARNLLVTGGDFYRDPTHLRPVFPDTLDLLLNGSGFEGQSFFFAVDERLIPASEASLAEIQDYVRVSRDMAWIGHKTADRGGW